MNEVHEIHFCGAAGDLELRRRILDDFIQTDLVLMEEALVDFFDLYLKGTVRVNSLVEDRRGRGFAGHDQSIAQ